MSTTTGRLLTSSDLADELQIPMRTFDAWAYEGVGPVYTKIGKHRRYRRADVDRWIAARIVRQRGGDVA